MGWLYPPVFLGWKPSSMSQECSVSSCGIWLSKWSWLCLRLIAGYDFIILTYSIGLSKGRVIMFHRKVVVLVHPPIFREYGGVRKCLKWGYPIIQKLDHRLIVALKPMVTWQFSILRNTHRGLVFHRSADWQITCLTPSHFCSQIWKSSITLKRGKQVQNHWLNFGMYS